MSRLLLNVECCDKTAEADFGETHKLGRSLHAAGSPQRITDQILLKLPHQLIQESLAQLLSTVAVRFEITHCREINTVPPIRMPVKT